MTSAHGARETRMFLKSLLRVLAAGILVGCGNANVSTVGTRCDASTPCSGDQVCTAGVCTAAGAPGGSSGPGSGPGSDGGTTGGTPCVGLQCQQKTCASGTTALTGKVYTPKGDLPLSGATVYVPNGTVAPFSTGVACERCSEATGNPLVSTTSDSDGSFRLENVPAGSNIPLVIQLGRWRRQVTLSTVPECQETPLEAALTRLPRNSAEGDIPKIAIATGGADPFECLLRKVGIDDTEITAPSGSGRVRFYRGHDGNDLASPAPRANELWSSLDTLKQYDLVILPCEGTPNTTEVPKSNQAKQNLLEYTNLGGRVFSTHYSYTWIQSAPAPFPSVANWNLGGEDPVSPYENPFDVTVDTAFQKGKDFADWLLNVQASTTHGTLTLRETRHNVNSVNAPAAQRWLHAQNPREGAPIVAHFTFNTPVSDLPPETAAEQQCGRVVFSSFHVSANALDTAQSTFPLNCKNEPPSPQEKALIFMLFDLSACISRDDAPTIR